MFEIYESKPNKMSATEAAYCPYCKQPVERTDHRCGRVYSGTSGTSTLEQAAVKMGKWWLNYYEYDSSGTGG